ncbi:MAG: hypothetical protein GY828_08490 [Candidatus Gracilibacteria bacterium]|nr:hypothetical protein [Candidatus Gracilibacteria bacterium]
MKKISIFILLGIFVKNTHAVQVRLDLSNTSDGIQAFNTYLNALESCKLYINNDPIEGDLKIDGTKKSILLAPGISHHLEAFCKGAPILYKGENRYKDLFYAETNTVIPKGSKQSEIIIDLVGYIASPANVIYVLPNYYSGSYDFHYQDYTQTGTIVEGEVQLLSEYDKPFNSFSSDGRNAGSITYRHYETKEIISNFESTASPVVEMIIDESGPSVSVTGAIQSHNGDLYNPDRCIIISRTGDVVLQDAPIPVDGNYKLRIYNNSNQIYDFEGDISIDGTYIDTLRSGRLSSPFKKGDKVTLSLKNITEDFKVCLVRNTDI